MINDIQTIEVPHLGRSTIGYRQGKAYNPAQPTLVLINSFTTSSVLYRPQFMDEALNGSVNLIAIEPYGHGATRTASEQFTYWDSAIASLQVLEALDIKSAFVLGTSQGGWIAARMALLSPRVIQGLIVLGTSMDYESEVSRSLGCWDVSESKTPLIDSLADSVGDDWAPSDGYCERLVRVSMGPDVSQSEKEFWNSTIKASYRGDEGRRRLRMCAINLRDRDGLYARLDSVTCPVLWLHGTDDPVFSVANAEHGIAKFTKSKNAELKIVQGGQHFLSASHPARVNEECLVFIKRWTS